jgi:tRNA threonylcarbamoyladenosine biosynthesis protein TsaB
MPKAKSLLEKKPNHFFVEDIFPSAKNLAVLAFQKFRQKQFEDVAYFEPFYLKEFFTPVKKN